MKRIINTTKYILAFGILVFQLSCNNYLDILPKGDKIPTTLLDFEAMLRDEYGNQRVAAGNSLNLLNDRYQTTANLNYSPLIKANYMWDQNANRIELNNSDETTYYASYASISTSNLLIENVPTSTDATEKEKAEVIAYAKVLRAMNYYNLVNYYADTYNKGDASSKLGVPVITSAVINAPSKQLTIQGVYDFILQDVEDAIPNLPKEAPTPLHANLGTAYAFLARVYLQLSDYDNSLKYTNLALDQNDKIYDWVEYYNNNKEQIEMEDSYTTTPSPTNYYYIENYVFRHGQDSYSSTEFPISIERRAQFEDGDARAAARWKIRTIGAETYYVSTTRGFFNQGGITTTEVYLIKAECLARAGYYQDAMDVLDKVREKRILPEKYQKRVANTEKEAIEYIRKTKNNEMILTLIPFTDARRYNMDAEYAITLTKEVENVNYSLSPNSYMWTMPFPMGAIKNPGNGIITQNVSK